MIGIQAKGLTHAVRLAHKRPTKILFFFNVSTNPIDGILYENEHEIYLLNREVHNASHPRDPFVGSLMSDTYNHVLMFEKTKLRRSEYFSHIKYIFVLPEDFEEQYSNFLNANKKLFTGLAEKSGYYTLNNSFSRYIFVISNGSKNFFQWAHNCRRNGVSVITIEQVLKWNDNYQQLSKNLKKGTITAYNKHAELFNLMEEQRQLRRAKRVNDTINLFNTQQKKLLRDMPYTDDAYEIMSRFNRLSSVKKNNFIRKMSTIDDVNEIMKQMAFISDFHFKWNKENVLEYISKNDFVNAKIVVDKDDILLLEVKDYDSVKRLAKNTAWCISKNKSYWNNYMSESHIASGTKQYILFDFSKNEDDRLSIVGFTIGKNRGITASHDFVNNNILDRKFNIITFLYKRFNSLARNATVGGGIHSILDEKGIDINTLFEPTKSNYLWNATDFMKYLTKIVGEDSIDVLSDTDNKLVVCVESPKIGNFFGRSYMNHIDSSMFDCEHILFADFNEPAESPNKLLYGIILYDAKTHESYCECIRNEMSETTPYTFDSLLEAYEMPYDIICRSDNKYNRLLSAFNSYELDGVKKLLKDESVVDMVRKDVTIASETSRPITFSITTLFSLEYIKAIYDSGLSLSNFMTIEDATSMVNRIIDNLHINRIENITDKEFDALMNGTIADSETSKCYALCYILKYIVDNEKNKDFIGMLKKNIEGMMFRRNVPFIYGLFGIEYSKPEQSPKATYSSYITITSPFSSY